ncbi:MAG: hypothetical protein R6V06_03875 [Kiritimatiellia bacterium]
MMQIAVILTICTNSQMRDRGEEACIKAVGSRTERAYKVVSSGKVAQHSDAQSLEDPVNAGMVQLEFVFLSGETLEEQLDQ